MKTIKVVISTDFGGFNLSGEVCEFIAKVNGWTRCADDYGYDYLLDTSGSRLDSWNIPRDNLGLVEAIEKLGSNGVYENLKVVKVPEGVNWYIAEYDGKEWVAERHRTWD